MIIILSTLSLSQRLIHVYCIILNYHLSPTSSLHVSIHSSEYLLYIYILPRSMYFSYTLLRYRASKHFSYISLIYIFICIRAHCIHILLYIYFLFNAGQWTNAHASEPHCRTRIYNCCLFLGTHGRHQWDTDYSRGLEGLLCRFMGTLIALSCRCIQTGCISLTFFFYHFFFF